jgi:hypothetical protein
MLRSKRSLDELNLQPYTGWLWALRVNGSAVDELISTLRATLANNPSSIGEVQRYLTPISVVTLNVVFC